ncbi:hypothetical protein ABMA27_012645 [Loxostege sticticalis]|uniref:WD repeat-containing protein 60 n=1 Tax=Loxostege sticticalis TaxID=481309 RepID=A0ABR3GZC2_LOXSC
MQTTVRKADSKAKPKEKTSKDDIAPLSKKPQDEKLKKSVYSVSTPRTYIQKSSTADIYAQRKNSAQLAKAPKKVPGSTNKTNVSPMKDLLKSSSSSISQISAKKVKTSPQIKNEAKIPNSARHATPRTAKDLPFVNVTVNSPIARKKLEKVGGKSSETVDRKKVHGKEVERHSSDIKERKKAVSKEVERQRSESKESRSNVDSKGVERQRSKTKTLNDDEVKVLTPDTVDNNAEMMNLSRKLTAKPKAFFVDLEGSKPKAYQIERQKESEDEVDYEDDFESYESDFESYHESPSDNTDHDTEELSTGEEENEPSASGNKDESQGESGDHRQKNELQEGHDDDAGSKEGSDEEKMLDSGNFELRDARSANKAKPAIMQDILEDTELDVRSSLTDEGFQEMSSNSSIKTVHTEVFERPLFIDFSKAKENKRKRKTFERLKQRAKDILSMVTLHEMSYSLFEMKPIPYDLYMATFGRTNYIQTAVQTFDDGITEEVQTEEILYEEKWTQYPIEFSKHDIYLKPRNNTRKYSHSTEDYLAKFTFLINNSTDVDINNMINVDKDYKTNPLRMYFEQKDGVGSAEMLPYESYKNRLKNKDFNTGKLSKFLKKVESKISNILSVNTGNTDSTELVKSSKYPFSEGYISISTKNITDDKYAFLKLLKITGVIFSETKSNLIMTVHGKSPNVLEQKCVVCLWDLSIVKSDPVKILIAIDNISVGKFRGNTDGVFVAALEDGSLHLWDLSEEPTWRPEVANTGKTTDLEEIDRRGMTQTELDREWNLRNSNVGFETVTPQYALQACAFTSSAMHIQKGDGADCIVGLEIDPKVVTQDSGRKILGQVCSLQRIGILTIWSLIQEKMKSSTDMGKAYWSKIKLELNQTVMLMDHLDLPRANSPESTFVPSFNLNAAKRRTSVRRKEKKQISRQRSAVKSDGPASAASVKNQILPRNNWETGIVCSDLKIMRVENRDHYLVAKNCGEVLCCTKTAGVLKINRFCVADKSSVTSLDVSTHSMPYFLAATDSGTVNLCSILESRVLLTLDCRNGPPSSESERYHVDHKGRYQGSASVKPDNSLLTIRPSAGIAVKSVSWSRINPCCMFALLRSGALLSWDLTRSDIRAECSAEAAAGGMAAADGALALVTSAGGEAQILRLRGERHAREHLELFRAYAALL